jgi:two-component system sensor histidine kinase HydH
LSDARPAQAELNITEMRLARLSVLQELTIAALELANPDASVDGFLQHVSERMGCVAAVWISQKHGATIELLAAAGISRPARELEIAPSDLPLGDVALPYSELQRAELKRWALPLNSIDESEHCLVLFLWRNSRAAQPGLEAMARRVADIFESAIRHRNLILDLQRSYDQLEKTQRTLVVRERLAALGEMAAVVAHEVRNPLGAIFNSLATLKKVVPQKSEAPGLLAIVEEEARRLNRITMDFLQFARPGGAQLHETEVQGVISATVEAAIAAGMIPAEVELAVHVDAGLPCVHLDGRLMHQALLNLLDNAVQASPRPGRVQVRAALRHAGAAHELCIEVVDAGAGIPPEAHDRLFEPFYTTKPSGTGLGLPIVKRIVEAHRGRVEVVSSGAGETVFSVFLPLDADPT